MNERDVKDVSMGIGRRDIFRRFTRVFVDEVV